MELLLTLNLENVLPEKSKDFENRTAVRSVLFDTTGHIALMRVSKKDYYKLPGGGVDEGETLEAALNRECLEEAGCEAEILQEIGQVDEIRGMHRLIQTSFAYIAKVRGEKKVPELTESEAADGFEVVWLSPDEALTKLRASSTVHDHSSYIVPRDIAILEKAVGVLSQHLAP